MTHHSHDVELRLDGVEADLMPVIGLSIGMKVVGLDRPWGEDGTPTQSFKIKRMEDIDALRGVCRHVYIEREAGANSEHAFKRPSVAKAAPPSQGKATFDWGDAPEESNAFGWECAPGRIL
ncbi:MAG: DUF3391 domain-containing protein [Pseudomonadota bacterium]